MPPIVWMLLAMLILFSITADNFLSVQNFMNILRQSVPLLILAIGQTMIVLTGGTDLSLGAQVSFTTVMWILMAQAGINIYVAAVLAVVFPIVIGIGNGLLVSKGKVPPFIATYGMQNIVNSIALTVTLGSSIYFSHDVFRTVYESEIIMIPTPIWIAVIVFIISWILLKKTKFGTNVYGLGGNAEALSLAGVNTTLSYIKTYAFAGLLAGISGLITACRVESGQPTVGSGWEFEAVAVTILGGTSLNTGKRGNRRDSLRCAFFEYASQWPEYIRCFGNVSECNHRNYRYGCYCTGRVDAQRTQLRRRKHEGKNGIE